MHPTEHNVWLPPGLIPCYATPDSIDYSSTSSPDPPWFQLQAYFFCVYRGTGICLRLARGYFNNDFDKHIIRI